MWEGIAQLTYHQHGGSGTNLSLPDALEWPHFVWWLQWLNDRREAEAEAIRDANRK